MCHFQNKLTALYLLITLIVVSWSDYCFTILDWFIVFLCAFIKVTSVSALVAACAVLCIVQL